MISRSLDVINFLRNGYTISGASFLQEFEDPTYIGFSIDFNFSDSSILYLINKNNIMQPLFFPEDDPESTIQYLKNINEIGRAEALIKFREMLKEVSQKKPWYFQEISGLETVLEIDTEKTARGYGKEISLKMLESIDLKITSLIELYKRIVWDDSGHRWILPENMRWFSCTLDFFDYRNFHRRTDSNIIEPVEVDSQLRKSAFEKDKGEISKIYNSVKNQIQCEINDNIRKYGEMGVDESANIGIKIAADDTWKPILSIKLDYCEFDVLKKPHGFYNNIKMNSISEEASQNITFKVGNVTERFDNSILNIVLDDLFIREEYNKSLAIHNKSYSIDSMYIDNKDAKKTKTKIISSEKITKLAEQRAEEEVAKVIKKQVLGNVYKGFSLSNINIKDVSKKIIDYIKKEIESKKINKSINFDEPKIDKEIENLNVDFKEVDNIIQKKIITNINFEENKTPNILPKKIEFIGPSSIK